MVPQTRYRPTEITQRKLTLLNSLSPPYLYPSFVPVDAASYPLYITYSEAPPLSPYPWSSNQLLETSLVVQGFRLQAPNAGGPGLIPGQGIRSHMLHLRPSTTE